MSREGAPSRRSRGRRAAERPRDECGIVGIHGHSEASTIAYLGLYALQHRGQESAGICTSQGGEQFVHRAMGLVSEVFNERNLARLPGRHAIGHVRYSTTGESRLRNAQPICANTDLGPVAIAHNGNLVNARAVRRELEGRGSIFSTTTDSEVVLHLLARSREATLEDRLIDALSRVKGAFSLVLLSHDALVAVRDPNGFRPLTLGRLDGAWVVASETCALDLIGAEVERDLDPGEAVVIRRGRLRTLRPFARAARESFCIFEYIYFARPDSNLRGGNVYAYRKDLGRLLAREHPVEADMVVPLLDSGHRGGARLRRGVGHPLRDGADPQPLRAPHLHRAGAVDPPLRREGQAQRDPRHPRREARRAGRRLDHPRHDADQDRDHAARRRRPRGARAHLGAAHRRALPLRHRHADARAS